MKRLVCLFLGLLLLSATAWGQDAPSREAALLNTFHTITSQELESYITELTLPKYRGRLTGTPEFLEVTQWVANRLAEWGLKPAGDDGTYFQWFDKDYTDVKSVGGLSIQFPQKDGSVLTKRYTFPEQYFPGSNSDSGTITAEVVYVGHGVTAPELGYDDYKGIDVQGKIVLMDTDVPAQRQDADYAQWVPYCYHQYKLTNAARHGAAGMLYVNALANPNTCFSKGLIYAQLGDEAVADLFAGTGKDHKALLQEIAKKRKPRSFSMNKTATITAETEYHPEGRGCNVLGLMEGSDPVLKEEVILVGGHLDAVGYYGEAYMPGALDNGSGIADMLAAARALATCAVRPRRSILFLFIGGEEGGLLGSKHYVAHPTLPQEKSLGYFNLDMVGVGSGLGVWGVASYPQVEACFKSMNDRYLHRPFRTSESRPLGVGRPRSDGWVFQNAGYRGLGFGTFYQEGEIRGNIFYHHPGDQLGILNLEIMEDISKLMFLGLLEMASQDTLF